MSGKHRKTLQAINHDPVISDIKWTDIEAMLKSLGAEVSKGRGVRVRIALNGVRAVFHRPTHRKRQIKALLNPCAVF